MNNNIIEDFYWDNSLLITTQHLQQLKILNYYQFWYLQSFKNSNNYGIIDFKYDISNLHKNKIIINKLFAIDKFGSIIDYDINYENDYIYNTDNNNNTKRQSFILQIELNNISLSQNDVIFIYLATISKNNSNSDNNQKYYYTTSNFTDNYDENSTESLNCIKNRPYLLLDNELLPKYSYFPIMKLKNNKNAWEITSFIPPFYILNKNHIFVEKVQKIINFLDIKLTNIAHKIIYYKQYQIIDYKASIDFFNYQIINPYFLNLKAELSKKYIDPYNLFICLDQLLINLLLSNGELQDKVSSKYDHDIMYYQIESLIEKIEKILPNVLKESLSLIAFEPMNNNSEQLFVTLPDEFQNIDNFIYIFCNCNNQDKENLKKIINQVVIYSENKASIIKNLRISGIKREIINNIQSIKEFSGVGSLHNSVCFKLNVNDSFFDKNSNLIIDISGFKEYKLFFNIAIKYEVNN